MRMTQRRGKQRRGSKVMIDDAKMLSLIGWVCVIAACIKYLL